MVSEDMIASRIVIKGLLDVVVEEHDREDLSVCATNLVYLSKRSENMCHHLINKLPENLLLFCNKYVNVSDDEIIDICINTVDQSHC